MAIMTIRDELRAAVESRHSRFHPYYQMWRAGTLKREAIAGWVQEHYHFTRDVRWLNAVMPCRVPYADVRATYQESIDEEEDPHDPHVEILLRFGEAMGLDREQVQQSKPLPTTQALLDWYFVLTRHRSMVEVVSGAQIGIESQPPTIFHQLAQPLKEHYGCTDEQIAFFPTHVEADTQHGGRAYDLVEKYARTPEQRARAVLAAREGAEKRWLYVDGIYIHYQLGYPLTDAPWHQYRAEYGPSPFYDAVY
jgi:pyrroloquinoline-quinone synthase